MISTFDLTLLGALVSAGGLLFLLSAHRLHLGFGRFMRAADQNGPGSGRTGEHAKHSARMAGVRWLTVGALTLFLAYTHGADEGYLFGPWADVMFHVTLLSACWTATAYRINQASGQPAAEAPTAPNAPLSSTAPAGSPAAEA